MKDYKHINTNHDDEFDFQTMFISAGLAASFLIILLVGGAM